MVDWKLIFTMDEGKNAFLSRNKYSNASYAVTLRDRATQNERTKAKGDEKLTVSSFKYSSNGAIQFDERTNDLPQFFSRYTSFV